MDEKVIAAINQNAVLRSLELLCAIDNQAKEKITGKNINIRFSVPGLNPMILVFSDGKLKAVFDNSVKTNVHLRFTGVEHFNKMVNGEAMPIPTKGFFKLSFLQGAFTELTNLLESYLKPDAERLKTDKSFAEINTKLTAYVAFSALSEIANHDKVGKMVADHTPHGRLVIKVANEPFIAVNVDNGEFSTDMQNCENPTAIMAFDDMDTAGGILRGEIDSFGAIGRGKLGVFGNINMIDHINKLLGLVARYLD
ncbi:MAG: hypothetical protein CR988_02765 [Treponema sp.]|nr:MAG: hypothetical protein CR988_02765 [Treponema sp.]